MELYEKSALYIWAPCALLVCLHCVRAAKRKCLCDAQDFLYISAAMAGPDIKVWVESALIKEGNFPRV